MLGFNTLLSDGEIQPANTRLVRHQDTRHGNSGLTPFDLWRANDGRFETYQRIQGREVFGDAEHIAAFVATARNETLFIGIYEVIGMGVAPEGLVDPLSQISVAGYNLYDLHLTKSLSEYAARLIVDWGAGYRSWVQRADRQNKTVVELRKEYQDPSFPGFLDFSCSITALQTLPPEWRTALESVAGVYLLTCPKSGNYGDSLLNPFSLTFTSAGE